MRTFNTLLFFFFCSFCVAQNWIDSVDLEKSDLLAFRDSSDLIGFRKRDKVVIEPRYQSGYNFYGNCTSVELDSNWIIIQRNGKVYADPGHDLISPIYRRHYFALKDSVFFLLDLSGKGMHHTKFIDIDYLAFLQELKNSSDPDAKLILRILEMYNVSKYVDNTWWREDVKYNISVFIMRRYWATKWAACQLLGSDPD
jgi:hypothetical protein